MRQEKVTVCVATLVFSWLTVTSITAAHGAVVSHEWVVDYTFWSPDCYEKLIIAVNGVFPGPTIRAKVGDTIVVTVRNNIPTEGIAIHWHGLTQRGTPWADGTPYISQCPINPHEKFTYTLTAESPGTYVWHGHYGMQRAAGLYGSLIIDPSPEVKEPFTYDGELSILLSDWWHTSMYYEELQLASTPFRWVGEPKSLLIQGRGAYDCTLVSDSEHCSLGIPQCAPYVLPVEPGKTYRLRIASVASLVSFNFVLEDHNLTVVEMDGTYVEPVQLSDIDVYSGESYSVLFTADRDTSRNYWAAVNVRGRKPVTPPGLAVLNYLPNRATTLPPSAVPISQPWNDFNYSMTKAGQFVTRKGYEVPLPKRATDRNLTLLNTQSIFEGKIKWAINNVTFEPPSTPFLSFLKYGVKGNQKKMLRDAYTPGYDIYKVPSNHNTASGCGYYEFLLNDVVDVVLQNANTLSVNNSEIHPWHMHGHKFWVLGYGNGVYSSSRDYPKLNLLNPPLRNTVPLFPYGWAFIRFVADNPGAWPFHCHLEPHLEMGMGVVFVEGLKELKSMQVPQQVLQCGLAEGNHTH